MKLIKVILSIIISFSLLWILVALFSPRNLGVSESIIIEQSSSEIFSQVNDLKKWNSWSEWNRLDTNMLITFSSVSSGEGASSTWKSESLGNGTQKIIESTPSERIRLLVSIADWGDSFAQWTFTSLEDFKTEVTWTFEDKEIAFLLRPLGFSFNNSISDDYVKGLSNLKEYCENLPQQNKKLVARIINVEPFNYISKHIVSNFEDVGTDMGKSYAELINLCSANNWEIIGMPFSINYRDTEELFEYDVAFKISNSVKAPKGFSSGTIEGGETLTISHFGLYENLPASYEILDNWMRDNGFKLNDHSYEIYITDPGTEPDSSKWETQVFYPITKASGI